MRRALLVDDETEICQLLRKLLERSGTHCDIAHNLSEGRAVLRKHKVYDVVFVDVNLPDGLGYDLIPEIKAMSPSARCIAISAVDSERDRAMRSGADLFIPKPFNREVIYSSIRELGPRPK